MVVIVPPALPGGLHSMVVVPGGVSSCAPPTGGGGIADTIQIGDITVTFGHGGRHFEGWTQNSIEAVKHAIANDVVSNPLALGHNPERIINVHGVNVVFRPYKRDDKLINIGTMFPQRS